MLAVVAVEVDKIVLSRIQVVVGTPPTAKVVGVRTGAVGVVGVVVLAVVGVVDYV